MPYLDNIAYTAHAVQRLDEREIPQRFVEEALAEGEVIEEYETHEEARYLLYYDFPDVGESMSLDIVYHVVAVDQAHGRTLVITAYDPRTQPDRWADDYKTRLD